MQPFVSALGTELGLASKEIADIIWLALQMQNSDETVEAATSLELSTAAETTDDRSRPSPENFIPPSDQDAQPDRASQAKSAEVHLNQPNANQASFGKQLALNVPDARSLREPLSLARSLKPLLRRVVTGWSTVLDEAATVDHIAAEQLWLPVLKPALEPWLDLALVVDESASMQLWQRTIAELQRLLSHYGVFRDVRVWGLVTDERGQVQLRPGLGATAQRQAARRPSELLDPSGRRLILVATDCVSSGWQDGSLLPALKLWATSGPLAIIQMLPEWLWSRTGLGFASAVRLQSLLPGVPNQQLIAKDLSPWDEVDLGAAIKVPVVTLEPEPFAAWTEMVMGKGGAWSPGFVFEAVPTPNRQVTQLPEVAVEGSAAQRVQRFRVTASPMARRLAGFLAAAPVISLPVVRIIQDRLLPDSRQVHIAEVFLGGLLKPLGEMKAEAGLEAVQYNFLNGVREVLLDSVPTSDSVDVLQEVSQFVAERLGLSLEAFTAVLRNPQQTKDVKLANKSRPFALVTAQILRRLGGKYVRFAEELEYPYQTVSGLIIDLKSFWNQVLERLKLQLSRPTFETWIKNSTPERLEQDCLVICTPNVFARNWLQKYYLETISDVVQEVLGRSIEIQLTILQVDESEDVKNSTEGWWPLIDAHNPESSPIKQSMQSELNPRYVFSRFVVGNSNRMAHAASLTVAESSGREFNPLFFCGSDGLGKTHLMQAIGHYRLEINPNARIVYVTAEQFTNDLITAIRKDSRQSFQDRYRTVDMLLIDDMQFIEGKEYTQEEFFHTFNTLQSSGRQIVIAADRPPRKIPRLQEGLCSRFSMGLIAEITPPDLETRMAILQKKAKDENIRISHEVIEYIADSCPSNIREMEGALIQAMAYISISRLPMTIENISHMLLLNKPSEQRKAAPDTVIKFVSETFDVSVDDLKGYSRRREISVARQIGMYLMQQHTDLSVRKIGEAFGGKAPTTVQYACEKIAQLKETDVDLRNALKQIGDQINFTS